MIPFEFRVAAVVLAIAGSIAFVRHEIKVHDDGVRAVVEAQATAAALKDSEAQRLEEQRRVAALAGIQDETARRLQSAQRDAAAAAVAAGSLRSRYAAALEELRRAGERPPVTGVISPAPDPGDLLADVQRRLDEAAGQLAAVADQRGAAGLACQRDYDALKP